MSKQFEFRLPEGPIRYKYQAFRDGEDFAQEGVAGAQNTAKSRMALDFLMSSGLNYPGVNMLIARATLVSLKASTLEDLESHYGVLFSGTGQFGSKNENQGVYRFPPALHPVTGLPVQSTLRAVGLDRENIEQLMRSTAFGRVFFEEADEIDGDTIDYIQTRARQQFYHRSKKVSHLCDSLSLRWGITAEEVFEILRADPRHAVGQERLEWDDPMPGRPVMKAAWNPKGDDHMWQRFVGIPYPEPYPTSEWVDQHVGIREQHTEAEELIQDEFRFMAGSIVKVPDPSDVNGYVRRWAARHDVDTGTVHLIRDGDDPDAPLSVPVSDAGLIVQRNMIYVFHWENESKNHLNDEDSYLMMNRGMRRQTKLGEIDKRAGRVFPNYVDEYLDRGGHLLRFPGKEALSRRRYSGIGGIDQGGAHPTAIIAAIYSAETDTMIIYDEYVRAGEAARASAYSAKELILPGMTKFTWGYDPQMNARRFDANAEEATVDHYREALGDTLYPGTRGDAGFHAVTRLLMESDDFIRSRSTPKLLVFDHCTWSRDALLKLMWRHVDKERNNPLVDVGDAIKFMVSVRTHAGVRMTIDAESLFKPRLAYNA